MRRLLILLLLAFVFSATGQVRWQSRDSLTYQQYLNKEWKPLLREVQNSLNDGVDFYYLRVRAGVAAYELKKYRQAADHFARAYNWYQNDEFLNYWYYYALVMAGRLDEANYLTANLPAGFLYRMQIRKGNFLNGVIAETQLSNNSNYSELIQQTPEHSGSYVIYRNIPRQQIYSGIGLEHQLSTRWMLFHGLSRLTIQKNQYFKAGDYNQTVFRESSVQQVQYYLQGRYFIGNGWHANAGFTIIGGSADNHTIDENVLGQKLIVPYSYAICDHFIHLGLTRDFKSLRPGLSAGIGNVDGFFQMQANGHLTLYPLGSANLYLTGDVSMHYDSSVERLKFIAMPKIGSKLGPFWIQAERSFGDIQNFSSAGGYVVYNSPEVIKQLTGFSVTLPMLNYRLYAMARYMHAIKEASTFDYVDKDNYTALPYQYNETSWLLSLKWYF